MILISHRGNIEQKNSEKENSINYVLNALYLGYNVEIDVWRVNNELFSGHDYPQYKLDNHFLYIRNLWIHCKNIETLVHFKDINFNGIYFWHQEDDVALTSNGYLWTYPNKRLTKYSIAVMPEISKYDNNTLKECYGICSDNIIKYKDIC